MTDKELERFREAELTLLNLRLEFESAKNDKIRGVWRVRDVFKELKDFISMHQNQVYNFLLFDFDFEEFYKSIVMEIRHMEAVLYPSVNQLPSTRSVLEGDIVRLVGSDRLFVCRGRKWIEI